MVTVIAVVTSAMLSLGAALSVGPLVTDGGRGDSIDPLAATLRLELTGCGAVSEHRASAMAIGDDLALTVAHAFENIESFVVRMADDSTTTATIVHLDTDLDIAIVRLDRPAPGHLRIAEDLDRADVDNRVVSFVSYADIEGPQEKSAIVLRFVNISLDGEGSRRGIELAADINAGDSGGPVLDGNGDVIGMIFATSRLGESGWATESTELVEALDEVGDPRELRCRRRGR